MFIRIVILGIFIATSLEAKNLKMIFWGFFERRFLNFTMRTNLKGLMLF